MSEEELFSAETPSDMPAENSETSEINSDTTKKPFAEDDASLSGMVSSVLRPQDDKERERIERELKKRQEKIEREKNGVPEKSKKIWLVFLLAAVIVFGIFAALKTPAVRRPLGKIYRALTARKQELKIWDDTQVIYEDTFRLKLNSTSSADKATLIINNGSKSTSVAGLAVYGMDEQVLVWEFLANRLSRGSYTYKVFVKNSEREDVKELRGSFEIK